MSRFTAFISRLRLLSFVYERLDDVTRSIRDEIHGSTAALHASQSALSQQISIVNRRVELVQEALGRIETRQATAQNSNDFSGNEYRVFSQCGEDGIIQYLLRHLTIHKRVFVEFGADNYNFESNTRFLLTNDNWAGLVFDGSEQNIKELRQAPAYWLYNLKAHQAFITAENINSLLSQHGITGEIGLLSIDIDGNDYWVWQAIDVISPVVMIVE